MYPATGSRREMRCGACGIQLLVPLEAPAVQCHVCKSVTKLRPPPRRANSLGPNNTGSPLPLRANSTGPNNTRPPGSTPYYNSNGVIPYYNGNGAAPHNYGTTHHNYGGGPYKNNNGMVPYSNGGVPYNSTNYGSPPYNNNGGSPPYNENGGVPYHSTNYGSPPYKNNGGSPPYNENGGSPPYNGSNTGVPYSSNGDSGAYKPVVGYPSQALRPQEQQQVLSTPPSPYGRKRALLCGLNYIGKSYSLKGSINDVRSMNNFLVRDMGFPPESILVLTESEGDPKRLPTKQNMRRALRWLVQGCQPGDSLVFHYSGHGSRQKDFSGDEHDGQDEVLCPLDHETEGGIIDDEINQTIVRPLPRGAKLHAIIDACYSGTVLDLPHVCKMNSEGRYYWEDHSKANAYKGTRGGEVFCISACEDHDVSSATSAFTGNNTMTGATTFSFIKTVQSNPALTYGCVLTLMRLAIRQAKSGGPPSKISQEPQLSSTAQFNVFSRRFML